MRFPDGVLEHYRRVVDAAHAAGIVPWVTLHHVVNPCWLAAWGAFAREGSRPEPSATFLGAVARANALEAAP